MQQTVNRVACRTVGLLRAEGLVRTVIGRDIFVTRLDERRPDRQREEGKDE
jgi:hypothetical protein